MKKRRLLSIVISLCMALALMPQMVFAADSATNVPYLDASGTQQTCGSATVVTSSDTEWTGTAENPGWYIAQGDVTIGSRVKVDGDVHLILTDGCTLTVNGGIGVRSNTSTHFTIYGQEKSTGKLNAYAASGSDNAGIGGSISGSPDGYADKITINGGNITAVGNGEGTGIGATGTVDGILGITINGGTVTATGGGSSGSSGIGVHEGGMSGAPITISGGTVMATGGGYGINASSNGTISTGANGHAVIFTSYARDVGSFFVMKHSKDSWCGVIFEGNSGQIYGEDVTPSESFEIPAGKTLTIDSEKSLTIPAGKTLTNNGKLYVDGTLSGTVGGDGDGDVYYNLDLKNCTTDSTGMETHNGKIYAKSGSRITLTPDTQPTGYVFDSWEVSPADVRIENNAFTMPKAALTVTAKWTACTHPGGLTHTPEVPSTYTEYGVKEYWTCSTCNMNFSDADGKTEITDLESWKADAGRIAKLPPEIIKGKGQTVTAGEKKALSFTSNAAFEDFKSVTLDCCELSEEYYEKAEGSIIITLDADYVATLPAGEHTIGIVSESGTATTTFTVVEKAATGTADDSDKDSNSDKDSVKTGDNTNLALWLALMLLSCAGITGVTAYTRRKRTNE